MKATGIVRRVDDLGRIVIPKEIRRTLRIKEGDPLEIFTDRDELLLYLKKKERGVELHWELRERHLNLLDPSPSTPTATATSSMPDDTMNTPSDISLILETHSIQNGKNGGFCKTEGV